MLDSRERTKVSHLSESQDAVENDLLANLPVRAAPEV